MRHAPSVVYPVGAGVLLARLLLSLAVLALAVQGLWLADLLLNTEGLAWRGLLGATAWLGAGGYALHAWQNRPRGELRWLDGAWSWYAAADAPACVGTVCVCCDLQSALLLRWQSASPERARRWLWLEQGDSPSNWLALRRAVHAARPDLEQNGPAKCSHKPSTQAPETSMPP